MLVIDGQQRLTTLSLLLSALARAIQNSSVPIQDITPEEIEGYYLFNTLGRGDLRYKLVLTQSDRPTLIQHLEGKELPTPASPRIVENYRFFEEQIAKAGVPLITIYKGIEKLIVVDISLDANYDNPQLIFESLNSTGLELSQADLIRNYVLTSILRKNSRLTAASVLQFYRRCSPGQNGDTITHCLKGGHACESDRFSIAVYSPDIPRRTVCLGRQTASGAILCSD
jgi:uncharacterized protein with ParB-like and HNH nuclease domain